MARQDGSDRFLQEAREWLALNLSTGKAAEEICAQLAVGFENKEILRLGDRGFWLEPQCILKEIAILEGRSKGNSITKLYKPFSHPPLKGLYHKHWFQSSFMARNLLNELYRDGTRGIDRALRRSFPDGEYEGKLLGDRQAGFMAHEIAINSYERRARPRKNNSGRLTGERIVFARFNESNYYLTLAHHRENMYEVFNRCIPSLFEYPELCDLETFSALNLLRNCGETFFRTP